MGIAGPVFIRTNLADHAHGFRARPLGSATLGVLDSLAHLELVEDAPFHRRVVEEEIALLARNEPETLVRQLLDLAFSHETLSPNTVVEKMQADRPCSPRRPLHNCTPQGQLGSGGGDSGRKGLAAAKRGFEKHREETKPL